MKRSPEELSELKSLELLPVDFEQEIGALKIAIKRVAKKDGPRKREALYGALLAARDAASDPHMREIESFYLDSRRIEDTQGPKEIRATVRRLINSTGTYPHDKAVLKSAIQLKFALDEFGKARKQIELPPTPAMLRIGRVMCASLERYQTAVNGFVAGVQEFQAPPPKRGRQH